MSIMRYERHLDDLRIGVVLQDDSDFPNVWRRILYDPPLMVKSSGRGIRDGMTDRCLDERPASDV